MHYLTKRMTGMSVVLALVIIGFGFPIHQVHADTNQQLEQEIQQLMQEVQQLEKELNGGGGGAGTCTFTRDLTVGVSGSDVTCLQNYLISGGYSIPAGATGYFGSETQAAVAAWQTANSIKPPKGYFGPLSQAEYQKLTQNNGGGGGNGGLQGGAATLTNYTLQSAGDTSNVQSGQDNTVAQASFNVKGGDVKVTDALVTLSANSSSYDQNPWDYFSTIKIYSGGQELNEVNVDNESDWADKNGNAWSVDVNKLGDVVRQGNTENLNVKVTTQNIDQANINQKFDIWFGDKAISATDSTGSTDTTGDHTQHVTMKFNGNQQQ